MRTPHERVPKLHNQDAVLSNFEYYFNKRSFRVGELMGEKHSFNQANYYYSSYLWNGVEILLYNITFDMPGSACKTLIGGL